MTLTPTDLGDVRDFSPDRGPGGHIAGLRGPLGRPFGGLIPLRGPPSQGDEHWVCIGVGWVTGADDGHAHESPFGQSGCGWWMLPGPKAQMQVQVQCAGAVVWLGLVARIKELDRCPEEGVGTETGHWEDCV